VCGLVKTCIGALHSRKGMQVFVNAQNLGRGAMLSKFAIAIFLCLCLERVFLATMTFFAFAILLEAFLGIDLLQLLPMIMPKKTFKKKC